MPIVSPFVDYAYRYFAKVRRDWSWIYQQHDSAIWQDSHTFDKNDSNILACIIQGPHHLHSNPNYFHC